MLIFQEVCTVILNIRTIRRFQNKNLSAVKELSFPSPDCLHSVYAICICEFKLAAVSLESSGRHVLRVPLKPNPYIPSIASSFIQNIPTLMPIHLYKILLSQFTDLNSLQPNSQSFRFLFLSLLLTSSFEYGNCGDPGASVDFLAQITEQRGQAPREFSCYWKEVHLY